MQTIARLAEAADIDLASAIEDAVGLAGLCAMIAAGFAMSSWF